MSSGQPVHLLIRFSDSLLKGGDTIGEHNQVVKQKGAVWFGKMGSPVAQTHIDILNKQVEQGVPTYIYLVKGNRRKSTAYRGDLILASKKVPDDELDLIPEYYKELEIPKHVKFWVKLTEISPIDFKELEKMKVASSVLPIGETLIKSSTGHFILKEARKTSS